MSDLLTKQYKELGLEDFKNLAVSIGSKLRGGEVLVLSSDLGGGKTTFAKSLVLAIGIDDHVSSPSFTITNQYRGEKTVHHFDFYRLNEPGLMSHELEEAMEDKNSIILIEWADIVKDLLPSGYIEVKIDKTKSDKRNITLTLPEDKEYIL